MFACCAAARIRADGPWAQPSVTLVALFAAIVLAPATAYLYLAHADWAWLYLVDSRRVPRMSVVPAVAAGAAALIGGYYGTGRLLAARLPARQVMAVVGGVAALIVALLLVARSRLLHVGSYADFHAGRAESLFAVKLGFVLVALAAGVGAASVYLALEILRDGRRAQARP